MKRTIKPKFSHQITFAVLFMKKEKKTPPVLVKFSGKLLKSVFKKHVSTLDVVMVTKGGRRRLKINICSV